MNLTWPNGAIDNVLFGFDANCTAPAADGKCLSENMTLFVLRPFPFYEVKGTDFTDGVDRHKFVVREFKPKATDAELQMKMGKEQWRCAAGDPKERAILLGTLVPLSFIGIAVYLWRFLCLFFNKVTVVGSKQYFVRCGQAGLWPCWFCCKSQMLVPDDLRDTCKWIQAQNTQKQIFSQGESESSIYNFLLQHKMYCVIIYTGRSLTLRESRLERGSKLYLGDAQFWAEWETDTRLLWARICRSAWLVQIEVLVFIAMWLVNASKLKMGMQLTSQPQKMNSLTNKLWKWQLSITRSLISNCGIWSLSLSWSLKWVQYAWQECVNTQESQSWRSRDSDLSSKQPAKCKCVTLVTGITGTCREVCSLVQHIIGVHRHVKQLAHYLWLSQTYQSDNQYL